MTNFKNNFLRLIDSGANQAKSLVESFNELIESFDMDAHMSYLNDRKKELIQKSNELFKDFNELLKQVKENLTDFSVTVPYDETTGEKIDYKVNGNKLEIEVSYSDETSTRSNRTCVIIPNNCDVEQMSFSKNSILKTATITIPKVFQPTKPETPVEEPKKEEVKKPKTKVIKKKSTTKKKQVVTVTEPEAEAEAPTETVQEGQSDTSEEHISSKLARKLQNNVSKYANALKRDSSGRFVRREPNT